MAAERMRRSDSGERRFLRVPRGICTGFHVRQAGDKPDEQVIGLLDSAENKKRATAHAHAA